MTHSGPVCTNCRKTCVVRSLHWQAGISDEALNGIRSLTGLRLLALGDSRVSSVALGSLRRSLPDLTVQMSQHTLRPLSADSGKNFSDDTGGAPEIVATIRQFTRLVARPQSRAAQLMTERPEVAQIRIAALRIYPSLKNVDWKLAYVGSNAALAVSSEFSESLCGGDLVFTCRLHRLGNEWKIDELVATSVRDGVGQTVVQFASANPKARATDAWLASPANVRQVTDFGRVRALFERSSSAGAAPSSQQVELGVTALRPAALGAQAVDFEPMSAHAERVASGHFFQDFGDGPVLKLDQLPANATNEMIVLRIAVIVLVDFPPIGPSDAAQETGFHHETQRAVDGGPADSHGSRPVDQSRRQLISVKMEMAGKHFIDDGRAFRSEPQAASGQKLLEFFPRRGRNFHRRQFAFGVLLSAGFSRGIHYRQSIAADSSRPLRAFHRNSVVPEAIEALICANRSARTSGDLLNLSKSWPAEEISTASFGFEEAGVCG